MTYFEPMSGITLEMVSSAVSGGEGITHLPSIMNDVTAAVEYLMSRDSCQSFNESQFRMSAENMLGLGAVASEWA